MELVPPFGAQARIAHNFFLTKVAVGVVSAVGAVSYDGLSGMWERVEARLGSLVIKPIYGRAEVAEREEFLTLLTEEQGSQKLVVDTSRIPKQKWRPHLMEEDWVVPCQAMCQSIWGGRVDRSARKKS